MENNNYLDQSLSDEVTYNISLAFSCIYKDRFVYDSGKNLWYERQNNEWKLVDVSVLKNLMAVDFIALYQQYKIILAEKANEKEKLKSCASIISFLKRDFIQKRLLNLCYIHFQNPEVLSLINGRQFGNEDDIKKCLEKYKTTFFDTGRAKVEIFFSNIANGNYRFLADLKDVLQDLISPPPSKKLYIWVSEEATGKSTVLKLVEKLTPVLHIPSLVEGIPRCKGELMYLNNLTPTDILSFVGTTNIICQLQKSSLNGIYDTKNSHVIHLCNAVENEEVIKKLPNVSFLVWPKNNIISYRKTPNEMEEIFKNNIEAFRAFIMK